jgi:hypothetical protein
VINAIFPLSFLWLSFIGIIFLGLGHEGHSYRSNREITHPPAGASVPEEGTAFE